MTKMLTPTNFSAIFDGTYFLMSGSDSPVSDAITILESNEDDGYMTATVEFQDRLFLVNYELDNPFYTNIVVEVAEENGEYLIAQM